MEITTYQAYLKCGLSMGYLRKLLVRQKIEGRELPVSPKRKIWLMKESSLNKFLKSDRRRGPKTKK